jgi:hypothetical protein
MKKHFAINKNAAGGLHLFGGQWFLGKRPINLGWHLHVDSFKTQSSHIFIDERKKKHSLFYL